MSARRKLHRLKSTVMPGALSEGDAVSFSETPGSSGKRVLNTTPSSKTPSSNWTCLRLLHNTLRTYRVKELRDAIDMPTRDKVRKFRSNVKSWISESLAPKSEAASPSSSTQISRMNTPSATLRADVESSRTEDSNQNTDNLSTNPSFGSALPGAPVADASLGEYVGLFGPLQNVVAELIECIETLEILLSERKEYKELQGELNVVFKELQDQCTRTMPPAMTMAIEGLCMSIQHELANIHELQGRSKLRQYIEAGNSVDEVLACYHRIQSNFQRVALSADVSMWRILDEMATDNRLNRLSPSLSACYNSAQAVGLKRGPCATGTRVDVLGQLVAWVSYSNPGSVYWINGMAGTGKTTIAYSLCQELDASRRLAATFFCSCLLPECRDISRIIPTIAYQLARCSHPFRFVLSGVLGDDPDAHTRLPHLQFDALLSQPLLRVKDTLPDHLVVVVDALDECDDKESMSQILDILLTKSSTLPIRFIVSSRPESEIRGEMVKQHDQVQSRVVLHELDRQAVRADIETYLRATLAQMEPTDEQIAALTERAGILFIYAATVVRYIGYDRFRRNPHSRLANVLSPSSGTENKHKEIDNLYPTVLRAALDNPDLDDSDREDIRQVLHTIICAQEPLTVEMLSKLLKLDDVDRVNAALRPLGSILHIYGASEMITTLHSSFPDYMFDVSRSKQYYCNPHERNRILALSCFDCIKGIRPQFSICGLESSFLPDDEVEGLEARVQNIITAQLF
ncbi:hypothetical protein B0J17DRAFT_716346 [Rhizoctonia solani]|nr:hypothetical protein B0J17DRAFT_716346 [Rhizoctonia solani]